MNWNTICVGDVCKYTTSGGTPRTSVASCYEPPTVPWLKTKEVNYCRIYQTESYISQEGLDNSSAKLIPENSVIVAMYGQGDTAGRVAINKVPISTNQACCNLIIDSEKADYEFVYYALSTLYEKLVSLKNGGAQPNLNAQIIRSVEIPFPPLETQHKIAAFLSAYDNLIENNQKQIKLLEEAAQRLYKEWFVNLRFPGHDTTPVVDGVPEGWKMTPLSEVAAINKTSISKQYPHDYIDYIDLGSVSKGHIESTTRFTVQEAPGRARRIAFDGDIIWGMVRPNLKSYAMVFHPAETNIFSTGFAVLHAEKVPFTFLYCHVTQEDFVSYLVNCTNGAAYPAVKPIHFEKVVFLLPTDEILTQFHKMAEPMYRKIETLENQIRNAKETRDRLLPKLMSGEIEV